MSVTEAAAKPTSLDLPVQNGGSTVVVDDHQPIILNGHGYGFGITELKVISPDLRSPSSLSQAKNGFYVSFLVDARGGIHRGRRHSGVDVHIPQHRVCQPTRITCKLLRKEKVASLPQLSDGEALASRVLETGPTSAKFSGCVQLDVPHFASLRDGEREIVIMRSDDGLTWYEHTQQQQSEQQQSPNDNADDDDDGSANRQIAKIYTSDFPRYFVAVTRLRVDIAAVTSKGSTLKSSVVPHVQAVLPPRSVNKDTKIGLQVLPVQNDVLQRTVGRVIPVSPVTTIEPRRRRFHEPITLTIPIPSGATLPSPKTKPDAQSLKLLYSIAGGSAGPQWEDITGSAALNIVNQTLSFATTLSARYWLLECTHVTDVVPTATEIYREAVVAPFIARFHVFCKRHTGSQAQIRVLCLTDEDIEKTFEVSTDNFTEIARSDPVEVLEGKPYYLSLSPGLSLAATSTLQPSLIFHSFRVNRLSFILRCSAQQLTSGTLSFSKQQQLQQQVETAVRGVVCSIPISLPAYDGEELLSPEQEPEIYEQRFNAAINSAAATRQTVEGSGQDAPPPVPALGGVEGLRLAEVARSLHGDWLPLASLLGITQREVVKIQQEFSDTEEQAMIMLHLWVEKAGIRATSSQLEAALKRIGREDLIKPTVLPPPPVNTVTTPESNEVNPIDSPMNPGNDVVKVLDFDTSADRSLLFDAGEVYEMEQVWDGKEWHKTKRLSKPVEESNDDNISAELNNVATTPSNQPVHQEQLESYQQQPETEQQQQQPVIEELATAELANHVTTAAVSETCVDDEPAATVAQAAEMSSDVDAVQEQGGSDVDDVRGGGRPSSLVTPQILIDGEPVVDTDVQESEETLPDGTVVRRKTTTTHTTCPSLTVTTPDGSKIYDESSFDGLDGGVVVSEDRIEGEPTVSTEVEETEETLEDGTVVKRKLVKTRQQQSITTSVTVQGPEGSDLDQITDAIMQGTYENSSSNSSKQKHNQ